MRAVKDIIANRLSVVDRTLILLYADCQSFHKLGERMGMSHTTVRKEIVRIKNEIRELYERLY